MCRIQSVLEGLLLSQLKVMMYRLNVVVNVKQYPARPRHRSDLVSTERLSCDGWAQFFRGYHVLAEPNPRSWLRRWSDLRFVFVIYLPCNINANQFNKSPPTKAQARHDERQKSKKEQPKQVLSSPRISYSEINRFDNFYNKK